MLIFQERKKFAIYPLRILLAVYYESVVNEFCGEITEEKETKIRKPSY